MMIYFVLLMFGLGSLMLYLIVSICKDAGKMEQTIEHDKEREKQQHESKDHDNLSDDELLDWLHKQDK